MDNDTRREVERTIERRLERALTTSKSPKLGLVGVAITVVVHGVAIVAFIATLNQRVSTVEAVALENKREIAQRTKTIYLVEHLKQAVEDLQRELRRRRGSLRED